LAPKQHSGISQNGAETTFAFSQKSFAENIVVGAVWLNKKV
jgi:hypothetical protein